MDELNYIMESRPEKELHIYIHDEAPRTSAFNLQVPRGYHDEITTKTLEQDTDLVQRSEIDCDNPCLGEEWISAVAAASKACREVRTLDYATWRAPRASLRKLTATRAHRLCKS
ncbi:MAG: hypothetical protein ACKPKO_08730, partial [Candidatus Fonsibacter sp.]